MLSRHRVDRLRSGLHGPWLWRLRRLDYILDFYGLVCEALGILRVSFDVWDCIFLGLHVWFILWGFRLLGSLLLGQVGS